MKRQRDKDSLATTDLDAKAKALAEEVKMLKSNKAGLEEATRILAVDTCQNLQVAKTLEAENAALHQTVDELKAEVSGSDVRKGGRQG